MTKKAVAEPAAWRSRIVGHGELAPETFKANPRNWRKHPKAQLSALADVLQQVGWVQDVVVNKTTGLLVDGHARVQVAIDAGEPMVPVVYVELTEDEEALMLASLDPLSAMAGVDPEKLSALLGVAAANGDALNEMLTKMGEKVNGQKGNGAPALGQPVISYQIIFDTDAQQQRWFGLLRDLKARYPNGETIAERLDLFLEETIA